MQRIQAVFFHQGTPWLGKVVLRTKAGLAALREAAAATFMGLSGTIADPHWPASWQSPAPPPPARRLDLGARYGNSAFRD